MGLIFREGTQQGPEKLEDLRWLVKQAESSDDVDKRVTYRHHGVFSNRDAARSSFLAMKGQASVPIQASLQALARGKESAHQGSLEVDSGRRGA